MPNATESSAYRAMVQERADLTTEGKALFGKAQAEKRGLTDVEKVRDDAINARIDVLQDDIARQERQRERERAVSGGGLDARVWDIEGPVRAAPRTPGGGPFESFGEQLEAIASAAQRGDQRAFEKLSAVPKYHQDKFRAATGDMTIASPSDGGFVVQTDFSSEIQRRMYELGSILRRVRRLPVSANANGIVLPYIDETSRATGSRYGAVSGYWVAEQGAPTASNPKLGRFTLTLNSLAALGYATEELLQDAPAMSALFGDSFSEELTWLLENAIIRGTGAGQPAGVVGAVATVSIAKETGQAAATLVMENLSKMWARFYARSRPNGVWFYNQDIEPQLDQLAKVIGTAGVEPNFVTYGPDGVLRIKGRPLEAVEYCSTLGTVGDLILADLSQYILIEKGGIQQANSMHVRFTTNEMAFRATYRVDGGPAWRTALTPANGTNPLSPYLTLATRA